MEFLPSDIIQEIVSPVPAESVLECKVVCKRWRTLIRGSNFTSMHLKRQLNHLHGGNDCNDNLAAKVEPCIFFACRIVNPTVLRTLLFHGGQMSDRISIGEKYIYNQNLKRIYHPPMHEDGMYDHLVGSCNGLVCAFQYHNLVMDPIYIFNPLTREYVYLPQIVVKKEDVDPGLIEEEPDLIVEGEVDMCNRIACGFGFVRSTNEYKVVRIHYLDEYCEEGNVEVYTLGSGCGWRAIGNTSYEVASMTGGVGIYANDAIYWTSYNFVVAFDLADEEFRLPPAPPCLQNCRHDDIGKFVALGRHLCLYMDDEFRMEIWSLIKSSDSKETWCKEFDINYEVIVGTHKRMLQPILLTRHGEIILLYAESVLYCYDPKTTFLKMISNEASNDNFQAVKAIAHVNTFASLEAMGENSKRYTVRPRRVGSPLDDVIDELDRVSPCEEIDTTTFRFR
ncbi:hypothetical protein MKW98_006166 [Papaver atlanticum]|uniref:F-box domain-containing protein n=1 Tax=Papaver atlanticum TaxID=357466 RepID=A0AAD4XU70_9MAGN|nr:hypothetical protein MKW98_006166 [Papaver atlanticum]